MRCFKLSAQACTTHVVVASEEHAASSEKIRQNMGAIAEVTAATVRRNRDIAASAEELGRQMEDLRQRIARFRVAEQGSA